MTLIFRKLLLIPRPSVARIRQNDDGSISKFDYILLDVLMYGIVILSDDRSRYYINSEFPRVLFLCVCWKVIWPTGKLIIAFFKRVH